jgi:hypothetical protein
MDTPLNDNFERKRLDEEAWREACNERYYRNCEAGCDLGETVLRAWVRQHWRGFLRARWIEHMQGVRFWAELHRCEFGLLCRSDLANSKELLGEIIDLLRRGAENLDILRWSRKHKSPAEQKVVAELLALININAYRLRCSFYDD